MPYTALHDYHLYIDIPTPLFKARINMATITYPVTALTFDGVTLGAYTAVYADQTLLLGSADGLDDYGRVRVQNPATSSTIPIGRISQGVEDGTITVVDNAYITVLDDYRVWAKIPVETAEGDVYKDSDLAVGDLMTEIPPVANCGVGFADTINAGTGVITVTLPDTASNTSFAMADGATITTYAWDIKDGTYTVGTSASAIITATFPPGKRWVALTVTDSNGKSHTSRCPVLAINPAADVTVPFTVGTLTSELKGQTLAINILDNMPRSTYPDGALVMLWQDAPLAPTDRGHMLFIGYHQSDSFSIRATARGLVRQTTLNCVDVAGRLDLLPAFPQALERNDSEEYWAYMPTLTLKKALHYLAHWHSTAFALADVTLPDVLEDDYPSMRLDSTGSSLYDQINGRANSAVPDYHFTCDWQGRLLFVADWMLLEAADRPITTGGALTEDYWSDIDVEYTRPPKIYLLDSSAVVCSTDWITLGGENTLPLAFCKAPGLAFGQGLSEARTAEKLTPSQEVLNNCEGQRYARINARYGLFRIKEPTGDVQAFQPAYMRRVQLNISAATAAQRGLDFTTCYGIVKRVDRAFNQTPTGTWVSPTISYERETFGVPAVTWIPEESEAPDYETPAPPPVTAPPSMGLVEGVAVVAGIGSDGYVYRTADFQTVSGSGGPTWDRVDTTIADTLYSFVVDPFSPGYIAGVGAINGWIANDTAIYRVTDLFGSATATSVHTFATATSGASYHWRTIQASFGAYFGVGANPWLLCVSYYGSTSGHTGTWATYSTDGGVTWAAEVQISAFYDSGSATRFNPIGVYTSPRTPGLAYTAAYTETGLVPLADGFVSTDWGATWTAISAPAVDDPAEPLPMWAWLDSSNATTLLGLGATGTLTSSSSDASGGGSASDSRNLFIAPPLNTKRLEVDWYWQGTHERTNAGSTIGSAVVANKHSTVTQTGSSTYSQPVLVGAGSASASGTFHTKWEFAGADWPINRTSIQTVLPSGTGVLGDRIAMSSNASASGSGQNCSATATVFGRVTEIELDNGTIYTPPLSGTGAIQPINAQAGSIYLPWDDNAAEQLIYYGALEHGASDEFTLKQAVGSTITDVSPTDSGVPFGVNHYGFAVRSYDGDRQFMAMGGIGNSTSNDAADDLVGLWVSSNAAAAWTNILAPVAASSTLYGLQIAFAGDNANVLFAWGGWSNGTLPAIYYSGDFGSTLDSREGNINSLGTVALIGIAGGPTGL